MNQKVQRVLLVCRDVSVFGLAVLLYVQSTQLGEIFSRVRIGTDELTDLSAKHEKLSERVKEVGIAIRDANESKLVKFDEVLHECEANNSGATCSITNPSEHAVTTCFVGTLTRKDSSMKIHTMIGCTGRMEPRSTVEVSVPYRRARANLLCPRDGLSSLPDWDKCEFSVSVPSVDNVKP